MKSTVLWMCSFSALLYENIDSFHQNNFIFTFFSFVLFFCFVFYVPFPFSAFPSKRNGYSPMIDYDLLFVLHPSLTVVDKLMFHPEAWSIST